MIHTDFSLCVRARARRPHSPVSYGGTATIEQVPRLLHVATQLLGKGLRESRKHKKKKKKC